MNAGGTANTRAVRSFQHRVSWFSLRSEMAVRPPAVFLGKMAKEQTMASPTVHVGLKIAIAVRYICLVEFIVVVLSLRWMLCSDHVGIM